MATVTKWGLARGATSDPTNSTDPAFTQPYSILATNDVWKHNVWIFGSNNAAQPSVRILIYRTFEVPSDYVGNPIWVINWTATLTSGNVVWDLDSRTVAGNDTASLDQASTEAALTVTDAAPTAANRRLEATITATAAHFTAGETVEFAFGRDGADAADTMAGSGILFDLGFRYDNA